MSDKGPKELDPRWTAQVTDEMMDDIRAKAVDDKVTCPVLRKYAEDWACRTRSRAPRPTWPASVSTTATSAASRSAVRLRVG